MLARKALRAMLVPLVRRVMSVLQDRKVFRATRALRVPKVMLVPLVHKVMSVLQARKARRAMLVPLVRKATSVLPVLRVRREKLVLRALRGWCGVAHGASNRRTRSAMW